MSAYYDDTPELARAHELPEVYNPEPVVHRHVNQQVNEVQQQEWSPLHSHPAAQLPQGPLQQVPPPVPQSVLYTKQDESLYGNNRQTMDSAAASTLHHYTAEPRESRPPYPSSTRGGGGGAFGPSSRLVLILSILCGILGVAVIGLAAGTGVVASKYADSSLKLEHMSSSYSVLAASATGTGTASSASASPTSYSDITLQCSDNPSKATEQKYTSPFIQKGLSTFVIYCNRDTKKDPLTSVFTENFEFCMESCASWNRYNKGDKACKAVTFIPSWKNLTTAISVDAPGDCYLKPGPQAKSLLSPENNTELHSAILSDDSDDGGNDDKPSETPKSTTTKAPKQTEAARLR